MNCPKCKKTTKLETKRTLAEGRQVKREKYCPKCNTRFYTIEVFQDDQEAMIAKYHGQLKELDTIATTAQGSYKKLISHLQAIGEYIKPQK
ncbi:MAG: hypothetical protein M0033_10110 [Nitrospiraceae bacterium]|nr:hypothetical protein [Nitrospiraceae bacterium]